jgi:hypothetical protein
MNGDIPIIDYALTLGFLWLYIVGPAKHIKNTASMWKAYGEDGEGLKQRLIGQYWKPPLVVIAILAGFFLFCLAMGSPPNSDLLCFYATIGKLATICLFAWPLIMLVRSYSKRTVLEKWKQQGLEYRIASGMASSGDIYGYMQGVKKREYKKGYWDGYRTPRPRH